MTKRIPASAIVISLFMIISCGLFAVGQSLDLPSKKWGISFGNSSEFSGLRFNFRDRQVKRITGLNVTLVRGIAVGIVNYAFKVNGVQIGLINIVRTNPKYLRILPIFNSSF